MHFVASGDSSKKRKNVLVVDNNCEFEILLRQPLTDTFADSSIVLNIVRAKDGPDAANKAENQRFDIVLIDTEVPRMMDGGFIYSLPVNKNIKQASVLVVSHKKVEELPDTLRKSKIFQKPVSSKEIIEFMVKTINQGPTPSTSAAAAPAPKNAVDVRLINAIIQSTLKTSKQMGVESINLEKAVSCQCEAPLRGVISSIVEVKSKGFTGLLAVTFEKDCYLEFMTHMLMEEQTDLNDENSEAIGELNNIILGNAKAELTDYDFQMTTPKVFKGAETVLPCPEGTAAMLVPFRTGRGLLYLVIAALPRG